MRFADTFQRDLQDLEAHHRQGIERLVAMDPLLHVDLADPAEARALQRVDQQPGLDAITTEEGQLLEQRAAPSLLAGEGLHDPG